MLELEISGGEFQELAEDVLKSGAAVRFLAHGSSMHPFVKDGDILETAPVEFARVHPGDILLVRTIHHRIIVHRLIKITLRGGHRRFLIKGDAGMKYDGWFDEDQILGVVSKIERNSKSVSLGTAGLRFRARIWAIASNIGTCFWLPGPIRRISSRILRKLVIPF